MIRSVVILVTVLVVVVMGLGGMSGLFSDRTESNGGVERVLATGPALPSQQSEAPPILSSGQNSVVLNAGPSGHYVIEALVNGESIRFLVDTGATMVALSPADAERIGLDVPNLNFNGRVQTANGITRVASVMLDDIRVGGIEMRDVHAAVIDSPMNISLLGMSFLKRLPGFEVRDKQLILRW